MGRRTSISLVGSGWRQDPLLDLFEARKIKNLSLCAVGADTNYVILPDPIEY